MTPVIDLEGVSLTYPGPPPVHALREATLSVEPGEFLAVTGRSGSGKSTLLNVLGLLERPTAGRYRLDGIDVADLSEPERSGLRGARLGFVFQAFHLLDARTALDNVALGQLYAGTARGLRLQRARASLERVGLAHRVAAVPRTMSGGERQRVAVARALVAEPSVLLADEPTGNLDAASAEAVLDLFAHLHRSGQTVVVVTHDPAVAARAERRVDMDDGRLRG